MKPSDLGLPAKFDKFRDVQVEAIEHGLDSFGRYRYCPEGLPVGCGKSLIAMALAKASGKRAVILTATKGLQDQYSKDFAGAGLVDIRGRSNYRCHHFEDRVNCQIGALEGCPHVEGGGCRYERKRDVARNASVVVTNYAYWFHVNERQPALGNVELLVLDEAHCAMDQLSNYLQIKILESSLRRALVPTPTGKTTVLSWSKLALEHLARIARMTKAAALKLKDQPSAHNHDVYEELSKLEECFAALAFMGETTNLWVLDDTKNGATEEGTAHGRVWCIDSVWPATNAVKLFQAAPSVLLMSGTLRPSTMTLLGIQESKYQFREWPRVFPAHLTPIYYIPTAWVSNGMKNKEDDLDCWVAQIDAIIDQRLDRKGIVHCVSYDWGEKIHARSRHGRILDRHARGENATEVFERFKQASAPRVLVSPSFSTGWNFAGEDCEYIIIAKVPYPNIKSPVVVARNERNGNYSNNVALQDLIQSAYRGTRHDKDRCEVFIIDICFSSLMKKVPNSKPMWFTWAQKNQLPPAGPRAPKNNS